MTITPTDKHRILVIDDNPRIHEDFRKILCPEATQTGISEAEQQLFGETTTTEVACHFELDSAHQGQEGLAMVERALAEGRPYSMAFVDVRMPPGWDGVETIGRLWACYPELQVVICTAYSDYSWDAIVSRLGRSDSLLILKKPFDNVEVLQLAHALTRKHAVTRQATQRMADLDRMVEQRTAELVEANEKLRKEVAERAHAQEQLRLSEERFSKAFRATPIPLALLERTGERIVDANDCFLTLLGRSAPELKGTPLPSLNPWVHPPDWQVLLDQLDQGSVVRHTPLHSRRKDGASRDLLVSLEPLVVAHTPCLLLIAQDITDQLQLETRLRQTQKMEAIGQLAAGVAHDFNNILTVISGHVALQLTNEQLDRDVIESLQQVHLASERAAALTRQLLAFGRKQVVEPKCLNVSKVVVELTEMLRRLIGDQVELSCSCPPQIPDIVGERTGIEQILVNLVVNARDAMHRGGSIRLRTEVVAIDANSVPNHPMARPGRFVCLSVQDNGHGIEPQILPRIFDPFFTTKEVGKGTGLGLATVYGIAKQHGGWVEVSSTVGQGTEFRVFLPCHQGRTANTGQTTILVRRRTDLCGSEKVLIVEDDAALRNLASQSLRRAGYEVFCAADAPEAERVWNQHSGQIDLLLTDVILPRGDRGEALAESLRKKKPNLKVVFSTGYSPELLKPEVMLLRGVNFLQKPYDPTTLVATIRHGLDAVEVPQGTPVPESFDVVLPADHPAAVQPNP